MNQQLTGMIIDDEPEAIEYLERLVCENCPGISIVSTAIASKLAVKNYFKFLPDLLFLDIHMDIKDGFGILSEIYAHHSPPYVIFVTAFEEYAIKAFKQDAVDYLLKPVAPEDLKNAVNKFIARKQKDAQADKINEFIGRYQRRIRFNTREGFILLDAKDMLYCEADRNYSKIYLTNGKYEIISMNLGSLEEKLPAFTFRRISKSYIINLEYLYKVDRKKKICSLINNGNSIVLPASRGKLLGLEI